MDGAAALCVLAVVPPLRASRPVVDGEESKETSGGTSASSIVIISVVDDSRETVTGLADTACRSTE